MNIDRVSTFFQRPQVQALLWRACGASGFIGAAVAKVCNHYGLPTPDPSTEAIFLTGAMTEGVEWFFAWYRNNPNNMLRRLAAHINGEQITGATKAAVAEAVSGIPGVVVHVDTSFRSPAPQAIQDLAASPTLPDVVSNSPGGSS